MKQYKFHPISEDYPLMSTKEYESLLSSMLEHGYEKSLPICLYEDQILDGRNRYNACRDLGLEAELTVFEGTLEEATSQSHMLNSSRRHLPQYQKAMIAAFSVLKTREDHTRKNLTIQKASSIFAVGHRTINEAIAIYKENIDIAKLVFNGNCNLYQAKEKIEQINCITKEAVDIDETVSSSDQTLQESSQAPEWNEGQSSNSSNAIIELQELQDKLDECMKEKEILMKGLAS